MKSASVYLGFTEDAIYKRIHRREIPSVHIGERVMIGKEDLDHLTDSNKYEVDEGALTRSSKEVA